MRALFLIGFPGAGKTTWRQLYLAEATRPTAVVSTDDLALAYARAHGISYFEAAKRKREGQARQALRAAVERGDDVIVDRTNLKAAARARFLRLLPPAYERRAVVFVTPWETLRARLQARAQAGGHAAPWGFVVAMMRDYEPPRPEEFDAVDYVTA